jgi:hypothetical protein
MPTPAAFRTPLALAFAAALFAASPAGACDVENLHGEMRNVCADFVQATRALAALVGARVTDAERAQLDALAEAAARHCEAQRLADAARETATLGVLIGRLEARYGLAAAAIN